MGTALNYICATCIDRINNQQRIEDYYINETDTNAPQSLVDIKINTKNFVIQRTKSFYEVYEKKKFLGNGAFGSVYKIKRRHSSGREIIRALKEISKEILNQNAESAEELKNEIEVLKKLDHPNIVKIFEFFEDDKNLYIIMNSAEEEMWPDFMINMGISRSFSLNISCIKYFMLYLFYILTKWFMVI